MIFPNVSSDFDRAKDELKKISPEELEARGIVTKCKHGYICPNPNCRNGSGRDATGAQFKLGDKGWQLMCGKCADGYDIIDILGFFFNLKPDSDFAEIVKKGCELFGITGSGVDDTERVKPAAEKKPAVPDQFKEIIERAHGRIGEFLKKHGGQWRGLNRITLDYFFVGYLPQWFARKDAPTSPRIIIPTSFNHYLARLDGKLADLDIPKGVYLEEKEHRGAKEIFNFKRALQDSDDPFCLLVEGEIDAMSIAQSQMRRDAAGTYRPAVNVIAISGSKLSADMKRQLKALPPKKFIVMLDNDDTGKQSAPILAATLQSLGHQAAAFNLPDKYNDANDFLREDPEYLAYFIETTLEDAKKTFKAAPVPATESTAPTATPDYDKLFEGLEPIKISAGAILNVADADTKPALEILFVERNFPAFVNCVAGEDVTQADGNEPDVVYQTPFGDYNISVAQVNSALKWLVTKLYPFFNGNDNELANFIRECLADAGSEGATKIIADKNFFATALADAQKITGKRFFDFGYKLKAKLIQFAKHSPEIFQSLLRFDYKKLAEFLQETFTDVICGELIIDIQQDFLRFTTDQATWYIWQENHWQAVTVKTLESLYAHWTPLARKARVFAEHESFKLHCELDDFAIQHDLRDKRSAAAEKYKRLQVRVKAADAKAKETATLEKSRNIESFFAQAAGLPEVQITTKQLDRKKFLFNCANCTINLETMETYTARQEDLITLATDTVYDPDVTDDTWNNFILSAIPNYELRDWLQRFFGYCLSGDTCEDIFLFIHGKGGSGKTTFLNAIGGTLGDYAKIFDVDLITANSKPKDGNEPNPALAALRACRLARSSETERNRRLDEAKIKHLTGGDKIVARELHKPPFEFFPDFTIVVDGNYLLDINDVYDQGIRRRIRIAPFNNPPDEDKIDTALDKKLSTPTAHSAILNWCIDGWIQYQQRGLKDTPQVMTSAQNNFYDANNAVEEFLDVYNYRADSREKISVKTVWNAYNEWRRRTPRRIPAYSRADFVDAVLQATKDDNVIVRDYDHTKYFYGFTIAPNPATPPPED